MPLNSVVVMVVVIACVRIEIILGYFFSVYFSVIRISSNFLKEK